MPNTYNHVGLCVTDPERSQRFYEGAFGFTLRNTLEVADEGTSKLLQVEAPVGLSAIYLVLDGFVLEPLHFDREGNDPRRARSFTEPGLTHLSLSVDDVPATCSLVRDFGGEVLEDTNVGAAVMVRDPDGQVIELIVAGALG